jgi:hypothetical protein
LNDALTNLGPNVSPTVAAQNDLIKEMIPKYTILCAYKYSLFSLSSFLLLHCVIHLWNFRMEETSERLQELVNENIGNERALKLLLDLYDKLEKVRAFKIIFSQLHKNRAENFIFIFSSLELGFGSFGLRRKRRR